MASSEDFRRVLHLYNQEAKSHGVSIVTYCQQHGIIYSQFERWYRDHAGVRVHKVRVVDGDGILDDASGTPKTDITTPSDDKECKCPNGRDKGHPSKPVAFVQIRTSSGLSIRQSNLDYRQLHALVDKLEGLC